jgi:hypothetical protein
MAAVRGVFFLNTMDFIRGAHGADAHVRILNALPAERAAPWGRKISWSSWLSLDDLLAYMETARRLLAGADPEFFRRMGREGALRYRSRAIGMTLSDPELAADYGSALWHLLVDVGEMDVRPGAGDETLVRIRGFPAHPAFCQRILGAVEGILSVAQRPARVEKRACVLAGDACCEIAFVEERRASGIAPLIRTA